MNEIIGRKPERAYKDRLFRMIFSDRKELLSLYNAINRITFYNGVETQPETQVMRLSDAYEKQEENHALELQVIVLNINPGYNKELMSDCKTLRDYMTYVEKVRTYKKKYGLEEAVERAIRECIDSGVLADFLRTNQSEAKHMSIYEYDEEKHMKQEREEYWQKGLREGSRGKVMELISKKLAKGKTPAEIADALEEDESTVKELMKELGKID